MTSKPDIFVNKGYGLEERHIHLSGHKTVPTVPPHLRVHLTTLNATVTIFSPYFI